jgi:hypothetical protein
MIGLGWNAWSSTGICLDGSVLFRCTTRGADLGSACVVLFLFLLVSTLGTFNTGAGPGIFETPECDEVLADCFFFVPFVETVGAVSFVEEDFRRVTVGLTGEALFTLKA